MIEQKYNKLIYLLKNKKMLMAKPVDFFENVSVSK
jgi:hypothetical protein